MTQSHPIQDGVFLVTTNARHRVPWLVQTGVREILIDNLCMTRNVYQGRLYGFCILPDHMHIVVNPGPKGISKFMHSFKRQAIDDIHKILMPSGGARTSAIPGVGSGECDGEIFWQKGFHARSLENSKALESALHYVATNPSHHGLVETSDTWLNSSLHYPDLLDSQEW